MTTGGKFIISRPENVEISLEYQCSNPLPEATKACTEPPTQPDDKSSDNSSPGNVEDKHNIRDVTNVLDLTKELPDDTVVNKAVLPDKMANDTSVLPDTTDPCGTSDITPPKTDSSSSDAYPDTTISAQALPETTDSTSGVVSIESAVDTTLNLDTTPHMSEQTRTGNLLDAEEVLPDETELETSKHTLPDTTAELMCVNGDVLPDETNPENPKCSLPDATTHEGTNEGNVTLSNMTVQEPPSESAQPPLKPSDSIVSASEETKEKMVGEITLTGLENTNSDSKGNLTLDDMPLGVSGMQPLETSSVISDPADGGVPESIPTTSINSNNLTDQNIEDTKHIAKKARMKSCIIKLTEVSNSEHEKWLTSENSLSQINKTTESIESLSSSSTVSRYNMRSKPVSVSSRPSRKRQCAVNYTEQGVKDS